MPDSKTSTDTLTCSRVAARLQLLAREFSAAGLTYPEFIVKLLEFEHSEVTSHELVLSATNTLDDWTRFSIKSAYAADESASFEVNLPTGEFRRLRF